MEVKCLRCGAMLMEANELDAKINCPSCNYEDTVRIYQEFLIYVDPESPPVMFDKSGHRMLIDILKTPTRVLTIGTVA